VFRLKLGLSLPEGELPGITPPSFDEMRKRIREGARDSSLIQRCVYTAESLGLSGEDRYVLLAYYALIELERQHELVTRFIACTPSAAPIIVQNPKRGET
jgi:hypothetical protein